MDDDGLVEASQKGDEEAFAELINRYQNYAQTIAFNCVKNVHDAEDIVQESFLKLIRSIKTFKKESKFSTWFYSLVYFTAIDWTRKHRRNLRSLEIEEEQNLISLESPSVVLEGKIRTEVIQKAIKMLSEEEVTLITLFHFMNQSLTEIAEIMCISNINTVKVKLFRARIQLKKNLDKFLHISTKDIL